MKLLFALGLVAGLAFTPTAMGAPANGGCQTGTPEGELACLKPDLKEVEKALDRQIYQLNSRLRQAPRTAKTKARQHLSTSQKNWKQYRESVCALEGLASAGTGPWLQVRTLECQMRLTKDRLEFLRDIDATLEEPRA